MNLQEILNWPYPGSHARNESKVFCQVSSTNNNSILRTTSKKLIWNDPTVLYREAIKLKEFPA